MTTLGVEAPLTPAATRRFYNWLGARHDMGSMFEREAKTRGFELLDVQPGDRVLNAGAGTGRDNATILAAAGPAGQVIGVDLSEVMLQLARQNAGAADYCQATVAALPFDDGLFDRLIATYLLDLLPLATIPIVLSQFRRVLRDDGRLVLVSLTQGIDLLSQAVVSVWEAAYAAHPLICGGCRPLQLSTLLQASGMALLSAEIVVQWGIPSEVVLAEKRE